VEELFLKKNVNLELKKFPNHPHQGGEESQWLKYCVNNSGGGTNLVFPLHVGVDVDVDVDVDVVVVGERVGDERKPKEEKEERRPK